MNFLISPPAQDELMFFGVDSYFESKEGSLFSYRVGFLEDETVTIEDTLGRYIPIDITEVDALIDVLMRISNFQSDKQAAGDMLIHSLTNGADLEA